MPTALVAIVAFPDCRFQNNILYKVRSILAMPNRRILTVQDFGANGVRHMEAEQILNLLNHFPKARLHVLEIIVRKK